MAEKKSDQKRETDREEGYRGEDGRKQIHVDSRYYANARGHACTRHCRERNGGRTVGVWGVEVYARDERES